ncbi:NAD-dependent histone deacetylase SIR2 [Candida viswanathii]|uniref:NAD-dependent histone deacetylase SIR2 n=1 Tax=Candida viswanathii TaxID=5486 RepID=A0A367XP31_9ASCO|nr:NAD-dependent histone deacetylase SIR2 [Candida viswanathii]
MNTFTQTVAATGEPPHTPATTNIHDNNINNNSNNNTPNAQGMITPASSDVDISNEPPQNPMDFIRNFRPDRELEESYREFIRTQGIEEFIRTKINKSMSKKDICVLILNLGYPKKALEDYNVLTLRELAKVLVHLIYNDRSLKPDEGDTSRDDDDDDDSSMDGSETEYEKETERRPGSFKQPLVPPFKYTLPEFIMGLSTARKIVVITGAGISTSLGIPDFRSFQGLYTQLSKLNLSDPQKVFDMQTFKRDPQLFYTIAHMVLPPEGKFALFHAFLKLLQDKDKLLRNYTQNIDNLEHRAGLSPDKLIQCHGSFSHAKCITCGATFKGEKIFKHIRKKQVPRCSKCWADVQEAELIYGVIKPTITFFGEDLPERFHRLHSRDLRNSDMVIISGTSLNVNPVASLIEKVPSNVPKILINKDPIEDLSSFFNLKLIGLCDEVVAWIAKCLGLDWNIPHADYSAKSEYSVASVNSSTYTIKKRS